MNKLPPEVLAEIIAHWDKKEPLCEKCLPLWKALSLSARRDIRRDYRYETED